jgi:hypothetical protein
MPSVKPITVSDLNGVEFNPGEMIIDDVVGYVGYARSLCTTLGTPEDTKEGYQDFLDFQNEIQSAHISTFEPDVVDVAHSFEAIDLTGHNEPIREYPLLTYSAMVNKVPFFSYSKGVTPFDLPEDGGMVYGDRWLSPYDMDGFEDLVSAAGNINPDDLLDIR